MESKGIAQDIKEISQRQDGPAKFLHKGEEECATGNCSASILHG